MCRLAPLPAVVSEQSGEGVFLLRGDERRVGIAERPDYGIGDVLVEVVDDLPLPAALGRAPRSSEFERVHTGPPIPLFHSRREVARGGWAVFVEVVDVRRFHRLDCGTVEGVRKVRAGGIGEG